MEDSGTVGGGGVMMSAGMDQIGAGGGGAATAIMMAPSSNVFAQQSSMFAAKQPFLFRSAASQQQQQAVSQSPLFGFQQPQQPTANPNRPPSANAADTTSDLATFREALIMHSIIFFVFILIISFTSCRFLLYLLRFKLRIGFYGRLLTKLISKISTK